MNDSATRDNALPASFEKAEDKNVISSSEIFKGIELALKLRSFAIYKLLL